ncbi:cytochrome P450 [Micromonospora sp. KC207]|uniref:cytochrome P450 n=1 Tax=Micromonospora sp. KC207 TaxID=2530377 RepID=UPI001045CD16|nr:cytochrome P450 [Micromonospora sp. KC207]TDC59568.1 cytochrome P450 [Micromonospora sp. KC207]
MDNTTDVPPQLDFDRDDVLDVIPLMRILQAQGPVRKVRTPFGSEAWVVTHHQAIRDLVTDPRIGRTHPDPESAARVFAAALGGPLGEHDDEQMNRAHQRMRRFLAGAFSPGRMRAMRPMIEARASALLDDLAAAERPADLHELVSWPLPVLVICDLLGVPDLEIERFRELSEAALDMANWAGAAAAWTELTDYMGGLVDRKRGAPRDDVLSMLIAEQAESDLGDDELVQMAAGLLAGGFETTVARIDLGTVLLVTNPAAADAVRADPDKVVGAVEEILRLAVPGGGALPRYAQEDIEIGGVTIARGDAVVFDANTANRDPRVFPDPDRFDITRSPNPHLSFGYGPSACIGSALGRIELQVVFTLLLQRFPTLRLAVPVQELMVRPNTLLGGLAALPVTW